MPEILVLLSGVGPSIHRGSRQPASPHSSEAGSLQAPLRNLLQAGILLDLCIHGRRLVNRPGLATKKEKGAASFRSPVTPALPTKRDS